LEWLSRVPDDSVHAVVTDPPYGVKEYDPDQLQKRASGNGGIWRIPPSFDGHSRAPLPRFTALDEGERERVRQFFVAWGKLVVRALRPGGHVFIATNAFIAQLLYGALVDAGLEFRGQIIRLVRTLRGGDRPKNAEEEFPGVSSMPKGCYEPWGLFRKPLPPKMTVGECLRRWQTGGLRRTADDKPFEDVLASERTPRRERDIADHPSLKPQSFLRRIVHAALPLGDGIIVDPFMGSGSTIAAVEAVGLCGIGIERYREYYDMATKAIPRLRRLELPKVDRVVAV
jgi:site-specific DNA-methyltransferase (adenine-specific)